MTDNGWSMSVQTSNVVAGTKGGVLFRLTMNSSNMYCQLTVGGVVSSEQHSHDYWFDGYEYRFISSGNNIFIWCAYNNRIVGVFTIVDKIGAWIGGTVWCGTYSSNNLFCGGTQYLNFHLFKDNTWFSKNDGQGPYVNNIIGTNGYDYAMSGTNTFNAAIVPLPLLIGQYNANTTYIHPLGFVPGVFKTSPDSGYHYYSGDVITISGKDYVVMGENDLIIELA